MKTLNLPLDLICRKFTVEGVTKEDLRGMLERLSAGLDAGMIELDVANHNCLQVFTDDPNLYAWLADAGHVSLALLSHLYRCDGNMLHGPECDCSILPPSKRQGQTETMLGARA